MVPAKRGSGTRAYHYLTQHFRLLGEAVVKVNFTTKATVIPSIPVSEESFHPGRTLPLE